MLSFKQFIQLIIEAPTRSKGWINVKTGESIVHSGLTPYHVQMIAKSPRDFGITDKDILAMLERRNDAMDSPDPEEDAKKDLRDIKRGNLDVDLGVERLVMENGWYRVVFGPHGEVGGIDVSERMLKKVLEIAEKEGIFSLEVSKQTTVYEYGPFDAEGRVSAKISEILDKTKMDRLLRGRSTSGRNMSDIGRTMALFR